MSNDVQEKSPSPRPESKAGLGTIGRLAGALGMVLIVSAPLTWFLTGEGGVLLFGKLGLGVVLCAIYAATNPSFWRRLLGSRSTGLAIMSVVSVVVVAGVVGVVNYLAYKHPREFDLTKEGLYTLSSETTGVLGRLTEPVVVYAFFGSNDPSYQAVQDTLRRYRTASDKLSFELVDPQSRPDLVEKFKITDRGPRIVVTARGQDARAKDASEEELTNAIIKVAQQTSKTIYFLTGHGEPDVEDGDSGEGYKSFAEALKAEGYAVEKLSLLRGREAQRGAKLAIGGPDAPAAAGDEVVVPPTVAVLVIAGARAALLPPELAALEKYLAKGGRVLAFLEPDSDAGLTGLLREWHLEVHKDLVVDTNPVNRLLGFGPAAPLVQPPESAGDHPVVKDLAAPAVFMTTRSLAIASGGSPGVEAKSLLETGQSAWGETNLVGGSASFDDKDFAGPVAVMAVATKATASEADKRSDEARLIVAGDSQWVDNKYLTVQGNRDVSVNAVHWLAEEQARIGIHPRARGASQLFLTGEQMGQLKFLAQDILPVLVVAFGLGIVLLRRKR